MANNHPNLTIHAFEPHKDAFKRLKENVNINKFSNRIYLYDYALSSKNGESYLEAKNRFGLSQSGGAKISDKGNIKVKYKIGDDLIKIENEHIAIKIDTEGHELFVLNGIKNLLAKNKVFLQIEIFPQNKIDVTKFLNNLGFELIMKSQFTHQKNILDYFFEKKFS